MNWLEKVGEEILNVLKKVEALFTSGKAQKAIEEAGALVQIALPIVQAIDALVPNKTVEEIEAAYQKYGVPFVATASTNVGNALLNLATTLLQKNLSSTQAGAALNILNTAVQLAVTAAHAG